MIATFYYLQLIKLMYFKDSNLFTYKVYTDLVLESNKPLSLNSSIILGISLYLILTLLFYPTPLLNLANDTILASLI